MKRRDLLTSALSAAALAALAPESVEAAGVFFRRQSGDVMEFGRRDWERPWLPELHRPNALGQPIPVPIGRTIDIVILGNGFLPNERRKFEAEAANWYSRFLSYSPYKELRGAFRVRSVWTPSQARCSTPQDTYFRIATDGNSVGQWSHPKTRAAVFEVLDRIGVNPMQTTPGTHFMTHTVVAMLMRNEKGVEPSGCTRTLVSPNKKRSVSMAIGEHVTHEFTHAYGRVRDEYINRADSVARRTTPREPSIYTVSNICYSRDPARIPWMHYAPGSTLNPDKNSLVGLLWEGGVTDVNTWHSQPHCLMNGPGHDNWSLDHSHFGGKSMRDFHHFCYWCREVIAARTYHKMGLLGDDTNGVTIWKRWVTDFRPGYLKYFQIAEHIRAANAEIARTGLVTAKLYMRPYTPEELARAKSVKEPLPETAKPDNKDPDDPDPEAPDAPDVPDPKEKFAL